MNQPISPITKKNNTTLSDTFLAKDIIALYNKQLDIDVSHFFSNAYSFNLYECKDTGYKFYYPEALDGDSNFYTSLQQQLGNKYYHDWKFENQLAFNEIKFNDKVLDIGCGVGNFLLKALKKTPDVYGLELNEEAIRICIDKDLQVYNQPIQDHAKTYENFYDVVCLFQVLEHIYDVKSFIEAALKVLKKGGKLIIGVPNNEPYFMGYDKYCTLNLPPHHMGLWNKNAFEKFAKIYNLSIIKVEYDVKGRVTAEAYSRAKYSARIKSLPGHHSASEKIKIIFFAFLTLPLTLVKKITKGLNGSHIAIVFEKN